MKDSKQHDAGVAQTLLDRMSNQRLPRALELKEKVDAGETLSEYDLNFLEEVFKDAQSIQPMVERHPEYQQLVSRAIHLYKEILGDVCGECGHVELRVHGAAELYRHYLHSLADLPPSPSFPFLP